MNDTLGEMFARCCLRAGDGIAVRAGGEERTYAQVLDAGRRLANVLHARGILPGDRVATLLDANVAAIEVAAGIALGGFVMVPINERLTASERDHQMRDAGARVLIHTDPLTAAADPLEAELTVHIGRADVDRGGAIGYERALAAADGTAPAHRATPGDLAVLAYTSGTTGFPKGAKVDHRSLMLAVRSAVGSLRIPNFSRLAYAGPLGQAIPWWTMLLPHLYVGGIVDLVAENDADAWFDAMSHDRSTYTFLPGPLLDEFIARGQRRPEVIYQLEVVNHTAAGARADQLDRLVALLGGRYLHGWSATELIGAGTCLTRNDAVGRGDAEDFRATVGRPMPTVTLEVLGAGGQALPPGRDHVGELAARAETIFSGYWNDDAATDAAFAGGRYLTGDVGWIDASGYAYVVDRKLDLIVSGGSGVVYPAEVERVLGDLDGIAEVAVVGVPDERGGESVAAVVVPRAGSALAEADVIAFAREHLGGFSAPATVHFVDALPRSTAHAVRKALLREQFSDH